MNKIKDRTGERHITNEGYEIEIIEYFSKKNCTVRFPSGLILYNKWYKSVRKGQIKNPYHPSVCGIGYLGEGIYNVKVNKKLTDHYIRWGNILKRSYYDKYQDKYPTYKGCSVDKRWHNFQIFSEWFNKNYIEGFELDKDILIKGNKIYSPETCCFIPKEINYLLTKSDSKRGKYPIGVQKRKGKFLAVLGLKGESKHLGSFNTIEEAFQVFKTAKEDHIKTVADRYKYQITERVYQALYNYTVEITD